MAKTILVDGVEIEYTEIGSGPPIVFVHGVYVTGALWQDVADRLSRNYRCILPTWPFGAQRNPAGPGVDLGVAAAGSRILRFIEALDLSQVTLVANDTGGGIVLAALGNSAHDFGRVAAMVFTNCDSFDHFPPPGFLPLVKLCRLNAAIGRGILRMLASRPGLNYFASSVTRHGIDVTRRPAIFGGFATSAQVRREAVRLTAEIDPKHTLAATAALETYPNPVLILWGAADKLFPVEDAHRLANAFPHAALRTIEDSSTYVMLDQPDDAAQAIREFLTSIA
ncbi:alpha/beta fold hydrolase [[Mycobacterium] vasticus]|uniref:Alpha/beta hydrolase n=1 Tax=[Mycobacterium] vasticus TaxID=2875777 RepID=A0ABU5YYS8_9MYCO|nr:alpha/beta hydrolase [Mycolicibacter sp. MYC017]MEB3070300.1 alpha/beta hydrolase [Mycolicibacter sp. MYC017]